MKESECNKKTVNNSENCIKNGVKYYENSEDYRNDNKIKRIPMSDLLRPVNYLDVERQEIFRFLDAIKLNK